MLLNYLKKFSKKLVRPIHKQQGQSLIILAGAFVALIGMLGLAIDLGLVYIEKIRVNRATDAAVLAAVVELPYEEDAMERAISYLELNGYDVGNDVEVYVRGCLATMGGNANEKWAPSDGNSGNEMDEPSARVEGYLYRPAAVPKEDVRARFMIDTGSFRGDDPGANECNKDQGEYGTASRIKVAGISLVEMNFMRLPSLGAFEEIPVYAEGIAESLSNLDIMIVFDLSGSMEFQTSCFDCWVKDTVWDTPQDATDYPYPENGYFNPLPFNITEAEAVTGLSENNSIPASALCHAEDYDGPFLNPVNYVRPSDRTDDPDGEFSNFFYSVHEAELYSSIFPLNGWDLVSRTPGQGFWSLQRGTSNEDGHPDPNINFDIYVGPDSNHDFLQGNQAGNWEEQSANPCYPGIADAGEGTVIDCTLGRGTSSDPTQTICAKQITGLGGSSIGPIDCSAYIKAQPSMVYPEQRGGIVLGGTYDENCFSSNCWNDPDFYSAPPYVEYDFTNRPDWGDETYIWIRAIGGGQAASVWEGVNADKKLSERTAVSGSWWREEVFWEVYRTDDSPTNNVLLSEETPLLAGTFSTVDYLNPPTEDSYWRDTRAINDEWRWIKLGQVPDSTIDEVQYTLRIYQGSAGYKIDRVLFTNNPTDTSTRMQIFEDDILSQNNGLGPKISQGSATREACNACNPAFGLTVTRSGTEETNTCSCRRNPNDSEVGWDAIGGCTRVPEGEEVNQLENDLFSGLEPLRSSKEAAKTFIRRLDPRFDQVGFVGFANDVVNDEIARSKLQCRTYAASVLGDAGRCYTTDPITYTRVIQAIENQWPLNGTDIGEGIREGLEELGVPESGETWNDSSPISNDCTDAVNDGNSCSRRQAAQRILILLTDGAPTDHPGASRGWSPADPDSDTCTNDATGLTPDQIWDGGAAAETISDPYYQCAMYYAFQARQSGITLYTIGLGGQIDADLLEAMATGAYTKPNGEEKRFFNGNGKFYSAATPVQLEAIFEEILDSIYVRIIG